MNEWPTPAPENTGPDYDLLAYQLIAVLGEEPLVRRAVERYEALTESQHSAAETERLLGTRQESSDQPPC